MAAPQRVVGRKWKVDQLYFLLSTTLLSAGAARRGGLVKDALLAQRRLALGRADAEEEEIQNHLLHSWRHMPLLSTTGHEYSDGRMA